MSLNSSARGEQRSGVELNPAGESKIFWVFDTPENEWSVTGGPGSFVSGFQYGHCGDDYYANDLARKDHNQYGKPIYAGIDGIVYVKDIKDRSGNYFAWGKEVIIYDSESKLALRYAHLSEYDASLNGKWISATSSKPIGKVGDTGLGKGAHLHIVLYKNVNSIEEDPISVSSCSVKNGACARSAREHAAKFSFIPRSNTETTADSPSLITGIISKTKSLFGISRDKQGETTLGQKRTLKKGDRVSINSGFQSNIEGTITDIGNGLICLQRSDDGKIHDTCIGIESIRMLSWVD